jgi:hypothetical protein
LSPSNLIISDITRASIKSSAYFQDNLTVDIEVNPQTLVAGADLIPLIPSCVKVRLTFRSFIKTTCPKTTLILLPNSKSSIKQK